MTPPAVRLGREQIPIAGVPFTYTFGAADAPSTRTVQYFEMVGHRALYEDGWKVVTRHEGGTPFDDDVWELYHVAADRSECHDLAAEQPDRVEAMVARWWEEAEAKGVLPLDDRLIELFGSRFRDRSVHPADRRYVYRPPLSPLPQQVGPAIGGRSWDLRATVDRPPGAGGVLFAVGTGNSGLTVHVMEDHLVFDYNCFGDHHVARSSGPVPTGATVLGVDFRRDGRGGTATLVVDGEPDATIEIPRVMGVISSIGPSVGFDHGSPVSDAYRSPNAFAGTIDSVEVQLVGRGGLGATEAAERMGMGTQ